MKRECVLDRDPEHYQSFFVDDFGQKILSMTAMCTEVHGIAFDLVADWRAISYAAVLPAKIPAYIKTFHDGMMSKKESFSSVLQFSEKIINRLVGDLPELSAQPELVRALRDKLVDISIQVRETLEAPVVMDADAAWTSFFGLHPFQMGLHEIQRSAFLRLYSSYESYLVRSTSYLLGEKVRVSQQDFRKKIRGAFGDLSEPVYCSTAMHKYRLIRHALIHAGARMTSDLRKVGELPVCIHAEAIHIFPGHIKKLYETLSAPSLRIAEAMIERIKKVNPDT